MTKQRSQRWGACRGLLPRCWAHSRQVGWNTLRRARALTTTMHQRHCSPAHPFSSQLPLAQLTSTSFRPHRLRAPPCLDISSINLFPSSPPACTIMPGHQQHQHPPSRSPPHAGIRACAAAARESLLAAAAALQDRWGVRLVWWFCCSQGKRTSWCAGAGIVYMAVPAVAWQACPWRHSGAPRLHPYTHTYTHTHTRTRTRTRTRTHTPARTHTYTRTHVCTHTHTHTHKRIHTHTPSGFHTGPRGHCRSRPSTARARAHLCLLMGEELMAGGEFGAARPHLLLVAHVHRRFGGRTWFGPS